MKPQPSEKVSINSYEVTQNIYLPIQSCPSNLTDNNSIIHQVRINKPSRTIFQQVNINSIRNKFEQLTYIVNNKINILMVSETKLDDMFPTSQFYLQGYTTPFRKDQTSKGFGILLYIREDMSFKIVKTESDVIMKVFSLTLT